MNHRSILIILMLSGLVFSCKPASSNQGLTSDRLSKLICECAQSVIVYNQELQLLVSSDDVEMITKKMAEGDGVMTNAIACITDEINEDISALLSTELEQLIDDDCHLDKRMAKDFLDKIAAFKIPEL